MNVRVLGIFVVIYVSFTIGYLLPENPLRNQISPSFFNFYSLFFEQNWNLFGNTLTTNYVTINYTCDMTNWKIFGSGELESHKKNRFNGSGKMTYALFYFTQNLLSEMYTDGDFSDEAISRNISKNRLFVVFKKMISLNCKNFNPPYKFRIVLNEQEKISEKNRLIPPVGLIIFEGGI